MKCINCGLEMFTGDFTGDNSVDCICNYCKQKQKDTIIYGWVCQKCGRSYSPYIDQCESCNRMVPYTEYGNSSGFVNPKW